MEDLNFVVYHHYTKDTNELFYVGSGRPCRALSIKSRNRAWNNIVTKHKGFIVKIIYAGITKLESMELEEVEIQLHKSKIVNWSLYYTPIGKGGEQHHFYKVPKELHPMFGRHNPNSSIAERNKLNSGKNSPVFGNKRPDLSNRNRLNFHHSGPRKVICVETGKEFNSVAEAARFLKLKTNIHRAIHKNSLAGGFHWKFIN